MTDTIHDFERNRSIDYVAQDVEDGNCSVEEAIDTLHHLYRYNREESLKILSEYGIYLEEEEEEE